MNHDDYKIETDGAHKRYRCACGKAGSWTKDGRLPGITKCMQRCQKKIVFKDLRSMSTGKAPMRTSREKAQANV